MYIIESFSLISLLKFDLFRILSKITIHIMKKNQSQSRFWYANKRVYFINFILQWNVIQRYYIIEVLLKSWNWYITDWSVNKNVSILSIYQGNKSKYSKKYVYTYRKSLEDNPAFHARSKQDKKKKLNKYKFNAILIKPRVSFNWKIATVPCLNFTYPFSIKKFR